MGFSYVEAVSTTAIMMNWPNCGNDYGEDLSRMIESEQANNELLHECRNHKNLAHFIQSQLSRRYGLAENVFPNHHHYPGVKFELQPKSISWGGRLTGTPFTIPYRCLVPLQTDFIK